MVLLTVLLVLVGRVLGLELARSCNRQRVARNLGAGVVAMALASALRKLERATQVVPSQTATPAFSHLYLVNPLSGETLGILFSTHPPVEERIRRLEAMAAGIRR